MSGAGSNRAAGYIYSVAPKDGTAIGAIFPGAVLQPLLSDAPVQHDPNKLIYLGSANSDVYVCFVRSDAPVKLQGRAGEGTDRRREQPGATTYDLPLLLNNVLGAKFKIVTGYPGSREIAVALERGEVQGACGMAGPGSRCCIPTGSRTRRSRAGATQHQGPRRPERGRAAGRRVREQRRRAQGDRARFQPGRIRPPYVLPPGVPVERVAALRKAFITALNDKDLRAEAGKMRFTSIRWRAKTCKSWYPNSMLHRRA